MFTSILVAVPGKRYRIRPVFPFAGECYLLVESYDATYCDWSITGQVGIPSNFTEQDIERVVTEAVDKYTSQVF